MKILTTTLVFVSLFCAEYALAQHEIVSIDSLNFQYIYMEFHENYDQRIENANLFYQECKKQNIKPVVPGEMFAILVNDKIPVWRLAFPVKENISVEQPLQTGTTQKLLVVRKKYNGPDIKSAIEILNLYLHELMMMVAGPVMIRWRDSGEESFNPQANIEIMIPVERIDAPTTIFAKIIRLTVCQSILLYFFTAIFLLIYQFKQSHLFFALFLFSLAISKIGWILGFFRYSIFSHYPQILYLGETFDFLIAPCLFLFVLSILQKGYRFRKRDVIHLIPFIVALALWILKYGMLPSEIKRNMILSGLYSPANDQVFGSIALHLQMIGYIIASLILIYLYKKEINEQVASVHSEQLTWLYLVITGFGVMKYAGLLKYHLYVRWGIFSEGLYALSVLCYLIFMLMVLYHLMKHPQLFSLIQIQLKKTRNGSLSGEMLQNYKNQLIRYMESHKPYKIPDLTIQKLADRVAIPPRSLSEVINDGFKQNFFEFVNTYRIKDAQRMITEYQKSKTILEILYEVGYNNKSVFNAIFKKYTGKTPTEFRVQMIKQQS